MTKIQIVQKPQARKDLKQIWTDIALDNPQAADKQLERIAERIEKLETFPELGRTYDTIGPHARVLITGNYLILYQCLGSQVEIVRVLHGRRDISLFSEEFRS